MMCVLIGGRNVFAVYCESAWMRNAKTSRTRLGSTRVSQQADALESGRLGALDWRLGRLMAVGTLKRSRLEL